MIYKQKRYLGSAGSLEAQEANVEAADNRHLDDVKPDQRKCHDILSKSDRHRPYDDRSYWFDGAPR